MLLLFTACTAMAAPGVKWGDISLSFEPNMGQEPAEVRYLARGSSYTLYLADGETVLAGHNQAPLRMKLFGANLGARVEGEGQEVSISNYFVGNDPSKWRTSVPNYGRARYRGLYPGIDLVYYGHHGSLEYDWVVSPGADPKAIRLTFDGTNRVRIDQQGDLVVRLGKNEYRHKKPVVYQDVAGKRIEVAGTWVLHGKEAGFRIGAYDRRQTLVIDPVLIYSTYLGGTGLDYGYGIAVDQAGNTYVTGGAGSTNFPAKNPMQPTLKGVEDVFVTKINANGSAIVYSTFLGGGGPDEGEGIAIDSAGNAYVTGKAGSFDFPMKGAIQGTWGGSGDAFLTKLNPSGSLVYSTYLGGNAIDYGNAIAVDPAGNAYVTGVTFSTNFPTVNPFQATKGAGLQQDAFVAKINPAGTAWVYATYLGGNAVDEGYAIAADANGNAYVTGYTGSTNFPLQSPYRGSNSASVDAFVTKLNPAGSALVYSTYLGGTGTDYGTAIAVDSPGNAYVAGVVGSADFPVVSAMQAHLAGADDAFVTKFNPAGSALVYSTYLGGGSEDQAYGLAIDPAGNAYVTGRTNSSDFPLTNAIQGTRFAFDMFVTELNAAGTTRLFSTFVGGTGSESGRGIVVDSRGNIHVAGEGTSTDFPIVNAIQTMNGAGAVSQDALVFLLGNSTPPSVFNDFARNGRSGALLYDPTHGNSSTELSNGDGTYSDVPNLFTTGFDILITGDFNGDGKADLIVYNAQTSLAYIGSGKGDGTFNFQSLPWSPGYDTVATGDLNADGKTDVVLYNSTTGTMYTAISNGDATFTYKYTLLSKQFTFVRLADFTGDGKADLFLYKATDGSASLGVGDGTGGFAFNPLTISPGYNLADIGDLNGDGKADLILYNAANGNAATGISTGAGGFTLTPLLFNPGFTSVRLADYTGDGYADVTVYNQTSGAASFGTGTGTGTFNFQSLLWSPGFDWVVPEDVNGDGRADVILYNSATFTEYTGISSGNGTFSYTPSIWFPGKLALDVAHLAAPLPPPGTLTLSRTSLNYGVNGTFVTSPQTISITFTNGSAVAWTASSNQPLISVSPTSGNGVGTFQVTLAPGATSGVITVTAPGAVSSPQQIQVNVTTAVVNRPFGSFDTPANNTTGISGAIPITGWGLDGVGVSNVGIWREPVPGEPTAPNGLVFVGDANIVPGARPDVQATYPNTPFNDRAGWGYQMLTNFLPNASGSGPKGNGTYNLHAIITNAAGVTLDLGTRTITVDNAHATAPFGTIDTPAQGATISGSAYVNFGWALTPNPYNIPTNGSTIFVYVDGVPQGHPVYNLARSDIQTLFPGYANTNGAVGFFYLDTTKLPDGIHTISWSVTDSGGRTGGIGSRYFTVANSGGVNVPAADEPIEAAQITSDATGIYSVSMEELGRIELPVGATSGYLLLNGERQPLPVGSSLKGGRFYWQAGLGFLGNYDLLFERPGNEPVRVHVEIRPKTYSKTELR
jgi:hypothetical protein